MAGRDVEIASESFLSGGTGMIERKKGDRCTATNNVLYIAITNCCIIARQYIMRLGWLGYEGPQCVSSQEA